MQFNPYPRSHVYSGWDILTYTLVISLSSAAFVLAMFLTPSASGVGTHEQLGLPACPVLHYTGYPCPSCGLTTSFVLAVRMDFIDAWIVQPFGVIVFFLALWSVLNSIHHIVRRVPLSRVIYSRRFDIVMYSLLVLYIASWFYKILAMKLTTF